MRGRVAWGICALVGLLAAPAAAQAPDGVGVTMGYPSGLGVLWHLSDRFALRPEISVARGSSETTSTSVIFGGTQSTTTEFRDWNTTAGLSVLITLRDDDRLRLYAAPRLAYSRGDVDRQSPTPSFAGLETSTDAIQTSVSAGAHYQLHRRFAVFGELGLHYGRQTLESRFDTANSKTTSWSTGVRSAIGAVLYF